MFQTLILIFIGGGLGCLARFGVSLGVQQFSDGRIPIATFLANILSCLIMGIMLYVFSGKLQEQNIRAFAIVGFCGGFSTFSTFSAETLEIFRRGQLLLGTANVVVSVVLCLLVLSFFVKK
ncbi:MAG TPA: fluoride efflux transporter CrcB [Bacteroidia bacterium]|nr:fluoride efflux transporter CrcB [Bacteroidia bacterium]